MQIGVAGCLTTFTLEDTNLEAVRVKGSAKGRSWDAHAVAGRRGQAAAAAKDWMLFTRTYWGTVLTMEMEPQRNKEDFTLYPCLTWEMLHDSADMKSKSAVWTVFVF